MKNLVKVVILVFVIQSSAQSNDVLLKHYEAYYAPNENSRRCSRCC